MTSRKQPPLKLTTATVAEITKRINRLRLDTENYEEVRTGIRTFFKSGIDAHGITLNPKQKLFRGVSYNDKPTTVDKLGAPPANIVTGFQRCNRPNSPMFYCATGIGPVFYELQPSVGDKVYVSKWSVIKPDFCVGYISPPDLSKFDHFLTAIYLFFDTKFMEPIHDDFSYRYKITAAITDFFVHENLYEPKIEGVQYTSAAYPGGAENLALLPSVVSKYLSLDYVEEWVIKQISKNGFVASADDIASNFDDGKIHWEGRSKEWIIPSKSICNFEMGPNGWIATLEDGSEIDPT